MVHTLTTEQLRKFVFAVDGLNDWPKHTDDPEVNFAVDCVVQDDDDQPTYDEQLYVREIEAFKKAGLGPTT